MVETLYGLQVDTPRVLLSTGKVVGEGFGHPPLDTLVLAMLVYWKGTLEILVALNTLDFRPLAAFIACQNKVSADAAICDERR